MQQCPQGHCVSLECDEPESHGLSSVPAGKSAMLGCGAEPNDSHHAWSDMKLSCCLTGLAIQLGEGGQQTCGEPQELPPT